MTTEDGTLEVHESGKGLSVEAGLYPAIVREIEPVDGQFGPQWRFTFSLDEYPEEEPWAWASANMGTKAKLYRWTGILLGRPLALEEKIARSDLVGKPCQLMIKEREVDGENRRFVDDIMKPKGAVPRPLESAPPPTPAPVSLKEGIVNEPTPPETCFCGAPIASYSPTGEPLCDTHNDLTLIEPEEPEAMSESVFIPVKEMKSRFDFQREAHFHFGIKDLPAALHKAGFKSTMDVQDWPIAWRLLCEKMAEPA